MNTPEIDVHINYSSEPDPECPYLRLPCVPRIGEHITSTQGRRYRIVAVTYDDRPTPINRTDVSIDVEPV